MDNRDFIQMFSKLTALCFANLLSPTMHDLTDHFCVCMCFVQARKKRNDAKPLIRRKSELPHDSTTVRALDTHKRADDYLSTSTENS